MLHFRPIETTLCSKAGLGATHTATVHSTKRATRTKPNQPASQSARALDFDAVHDAVRAPASHSIVLCMMASTNITGQYFKLKVYQHSTFHTGQYLKLEVYPPTREDTEGHFAVLRVGG